MRALNRYNTITVLPVLIATDDGNNADGAVIIPTGFPDLIERVESVAVRVVPANALRAVASARSRAALEKQFGAINPVRWEKLLATIALRESVRQHSGEERRSYHQHTLRAWSYIHKIAAEQIHRLPQREQLPPDLAPWKDGTAALTRVGKANRALRPEESLAGVVADIDRVSDLILWRSKGKKNSVYRVGLYVSTLADALETLAILKLAEPPALVACRGCKRLFEYIGRKRIYCTDDCANRYRVRKSRRKHSRAQR